MNRACRRYYIIALCVLLAVAAYPVAMGLKLVAIQLTRGAVAPEDYTRYVVPYAAVGLAVSITAALYPVISKVRKWTVPVATVVALGLFVGLELYMESITFNSSAVAVISGETYQADSAVDWQLFSCFQSPDAIQAYRNAGAQDASKVNAIFLRPYGDAFKIHYFLVSFILIAMTVSVFYNFVSMLPDAGRQRNRIPVLLQLCTLVLLLAVCVFANTTGFFRSAEVYQEALPFFLTYLFFIILGGSGGIWLGSALLHKGYAHCVRLPVLFAMLVCAVMYYGEYNLLGGALYRFGDSFPFRALPAVALAPADILVILLAGAAAGIVMARTEKAYSKRAASPPATPAAHGPARA
jgi:hypothetical protein